MKDLSTNVVGEVFCLILFVTLTALPVIALHLLKRPCGHVTTATIINTTANTATSTTGDGRVVAAHGSAMEAMIDDCVLAMASIALCITDPINATKRLSRQ